MKDPILLNKLWREVEAGRVNASQSGSLTIFKYTQDCHIDNLWNEVNRQARGIIFQTDGTVVARPFEKFFNLNERSETHPDQLPWSEGVEVFEKLDGSCGIGYHSDVILKDAPAFVDGVCAGYLPRWLLATPGSMESDQAFEGTKILNQKIAPQICDPDACMLLEPRYKLKHLPTDCTPVFEIIYPENRIVVDYGGEAFLVLLAIFEHNGVEWHPRRVDQIAELCGFRRPRTYDIDLRGDVPFDANSEGYVARFGNGFRVKVKSPTYLRIHRLLDCLSPKGVIELIRGSEYGSTVKQLPKAIACDFDDVRAHVQGMYDRIFTDAYENLNRIECELGANALRKTQALWIQKNVANAECGFVFALLDDKDIENNIWKLVMQQVKDEAGPRTVEVV